MEMHQVRYFLAMARDLNFTRAAEACNVSQPSLTRAIQKLEDEFGGALFRRERARTHLTDLGRMMLPHLERTYEAAQAAKALARDVGKAQVAPLALGVASSIRSPILDEVLRELSEGLGGFSLTIKNAPSQALLEDAITGTLDLVLIEAPEEEHAPDRLESWPLYTLSYRFAVDTDHRLATKKEVVLSEATKEPWIDCGGAGYAIVRRHSASAGHEINARHVAHDPAQVLRLVAAGLGCAYTPTAADDPRVVAMRITDLPDTHPVILAAIAGRRRPLAAESFLRASRARDWMPATAGE